jgi:hypothetical protein
MSFWSARELCILVKKLTWIVLRTVAYSQGNHDSAPCTTERLLLGVMSKGNVVSLFLTYEQRLTMNTKHVDILYVL